jgi:thioredoxin-like negative regulator of GroEL
LAITVVVSVSAEDGSHMVPMTTADFVQNIMDYRTNPTVWVYRGDKPSVVYFYAEWCLPCRTATAALETLAAEYQDEVHVYRVDTEREPALAHALGISQVPVFIFAPMQGNPKLAVGGGRNEEELRTALRGHIEAVLRHPDTDPGR